MQAQEYEFALTEGIPTIHGAGNSAQVMGCLLCTGESSHLREVDGVDYYDCPVCDFIFADPELIAKIDQGQASRDYDDDYWLAELASAQHRSFGSSLARLAEALLYCTIPVNRFIDIGSGPGYLLDAISLHLPTHAEVFYGVEKFPPLPVYRTRNHNYICADLADVRLKFECGICIEVIEHLTPAMARGLAAAIAKVSVPGSLYLFNTGLTDYVRHEDPGYLDPFKRGHITCWSVQAARQIFEPEGFIVRPLTGKSWAFVVEVPGLPERMNVPLGDRIWTAEASNVAILSDKKMGDVMYILGRESARAY
jgi:hypothetical protein